MKFSAQCQDCQKQIDMYRNPKYYSRKSGKCCGCLVAYEEVRRRTTYYKEYGITLEDYSKMLADQKGMCAACGMPEKNLHAKTKERLPLAIDHNHKTGRVRGLLCSNCNMALGLMKESPDRIAGLLRYAIKQEREDDIAEDIAYAESHPTIETEEPETKQEAPRKRNTKRRSNATIDCDLALKNLEKNLGITRPFDFTYKPPRKKKQV